MTGKTLDLARNSFEIIERTFAFNDLARADEAFICASNKEIMPVHHVDDVQILHSRDQGHQEQKSHHRGWHHDSAHEFGFEFLEQLEQKVNDLERQLADAPYRQDFWLNDLTHFPRNYT